MMKRKPSWLFWLFWLAVYTVTDLLIQKIWHGEVTRPETIAGLKESIIAATLTWAFALLRWHKSENS